MTNNKSSSGQLFTLAWPIFVNGVLGIILGFIDVLVLSKVDDLAASAIGAACQITSISGLILSAVCSAVSIMVAQYLGGGDRRKVSSVSVLCISINTFLGVVIGAIVIIFQRDFLVALGAEGELLTMALAYIGVLAWGIVLDAYSSAIGSIIYSHGKTKISMLISTSMGILNLILDILLVLGLFGFPKMGVVGAAIATLITKLINSILMSVVFFGKIEPIGSFRLLKETRFRDIRAIFRLGIPGVFDSANYSLTQLVITGIIFHYLVEDQIIARTYLCTIAAFFSQMTNALACATQIMVGYEIGAGHPEKAEEDCARCLKLSVAATMVVSVGAVFFARPLFGIFTENEKVIQIGISLMMINVLVEFGRALNVVYIWSLRGAGDVSFPVFVAACCMWIVSVGGAYAVVNLTTFGIVGIWFISGVDECIRGTIMTGRWKSGKWKTKRIT